MKNAEEWWNENKETRPCGHGDTIETATLTIPLIKQIQLDAMKEGMRRAVKEMTQYHLGDTKQSQITQQAILTTAEQLTEKDL